MTVNPAIQTYYLTEVKTQYRVGIKRFIYLYLRSIIFVQYTIVNMNAMVRKQIKNEVNKIKDLCWIGTT